MKSWMDDFIEVAANVLARRWLIQNNQSKDRLCQPTAESSLSARAGSAAATSTGDSTPPGCDIN